MSNHLNQTTKPALDLEEPGRISLKLQQKQTLELTTKELEQWFAQLERGPLSSAKDKSKKQTTQPKDSHTPELAAKFVSRLGFKNPQDLITFLKSPAGESTKAMIGETLNEKHSLEEERRRIHQERAAMKQRLIAFLIASYLHKKEVKAHQLYDQIQNEIDKLLHHETHHVEAESEPEHRHLEQILEVYDQDIAALEQILEREKSYLATLEIEKASLDQMSKEMQYKYDSYESHLDEIHHFVNEHTNADNPETLSELKQSTFHEKIKALSEHIEQASYKVAELLEAGFEKEARAHLAQSNAKNLQIAMLKDMLAVAKGECVFCRLDGEPVRSLAQAELILPKDKKVVKEGEKHYLLNHDQKLDDIPLEEKESAHYAFLKMKPEMMSVKRQVQHNRDLEERAHHQQQTSLSQHRRSLQSGMTTLSNQIKQIQAARAQVQASLKDVTGDEAATIPSHLSPLTCTSTPTPTTIGSVTSPKPRMPTAHAKRLEETGFEKRQEATMRSQKTAPGLFTPQPGKHIPPAVLKSFLAKARQMQTTAEALHSGRTSQATPTPFSIRPKQS